MKIRQCDSESDAKGGETCNLEMIEIVKLLNYEPLSRKMEVRGNLFDVN